MDPYISIGKESIEKERIGIDRYIYRNKRKGNERRNINHVSTKTSRGEVWRPKLSLATEKTQECQKSSLLLTYSFKLVTLHT